MDDQIGSLIESGCWSEAENLVREQLFDLKNPSGCCYWVKVLEENGELDKALSGLELLVSVYPERIPFLLEYARLLVLNGFYEKAIDVWEKILEISPDSSTARYNMAKACSEIGKYEQAILNYEELLRFFPGHENAIFNLANLRQRVGDFALAADLYRQLLARNPFYLEAWINAGKAYKSLALYSKSEFCYRRVLELEPENVAAHWNLSHLLLVQERWQEGWLEYEWRLRRSAAFLPAELKTLPVWRGDSLSDRCILLWVEQGAGDAIQFVRFVPLLPGPPKKVTIYCPPNLLRLMEAAEGVDQVISYDSVTFPVADCHLSLLSLPYRLTLSNESAFVCKPYIQLPQDCELDEIKVTLIKDDLRVGLVWAGNPQHANDANRSLSVDAFAGMFEIPGVSFFSLQIFAGEQDQLLIDKPPHPAIINLAPLLNDFADTARWLSKLDLLITVDTAVAHLAGALGLPVWILLPKESDWRWGLDRTDSLWYPSSRLFRQNQAGEWGPVIADVTQELLKLSRG